MEKESTNGMTICMVAAECAPFAKVGGLADVIGALPKALERLGHKVMVMLPKYASIDLTGHKVEQVLFGGGKVLSVPFGKSTEHLGVYRTTLPGSSVDLYLLENHSLYGRSNIYVDEKTGNGYEDNAQRYLFLSRASLELLRALRVKVDILHCHDNQAAPAVAMAKTQLADDPVLSRAATVFTIHNIGPGYQGEYDQSVLEYGGFGPGPFSAMSPFEFKGKTNFIKVALIYSDVISTVSERYAREIQESEEFGAGLEGVLSSRAEDLYGIINGIDYNVWNPEVDSLIAARYSATNLKGKAANKTALLKLSNLPVPKRRIPLLGLISRLADQKGFDILSECIRDVLSLDVLFVVLGTGDPRYHTMFQELVKQYPTKIAATLGFDNELAHQIEAGADMFLMPSKYEPCGLNQLYSLKYGTVPVVRETGGLADTIEDFDPRTRKGTGFVFQEYSGEALHQAIYRAIACYHTPDAWDQLVRNGMSRDFSWDASAKKYTELYRTAIQRSSERETAEVS